MFGGYPRYPMVRRLVRLRWAGPALELVGAAGRLVGAADRDAGRQLRKAGRFARLPRAAMLGAVHTYFDEAELAELLDPELVAAGRAEGPTHQRLMRFVPAALDDAAEQLMAAEITTVLHADYLRKVDVASSAHGLEVRTPYLDRAVFDLTARLPLSLKLRPGSLKHVLRALARRHLPAHVVDRPKQGFGIPLDRWASPAMNDFLADILLGADARCRGWLRPHTVRPLLDAYRTGAPADVSRYQVYQRVFMLASFELWLRAWSPTLA
jgi:asparagine synthase (glutamine-hydrolysing)